MDALGIWSMQSGCHSKMAAMGRGPITEQLPCGLGPIINIGLNKILGALGMPLLPWSFGDEQLDAWKHIG